MISRREAVVVLVCMCCLAFMAVPTRASAVGRARIVIYGDSLTVESQAYIAQEFDPTKVQLVWHVFSGTALCQWLSSMASESKTATAAVLIEFAGNSQDVNGCMNDPSTGHAYVAGSSGWLTKYRADATQAQAIWSAAKVPTYFTQDPPLPHYGSAGGNLNTYPLNRVYQSLADHFVLAGATVAADDGSFTYWKHCDRTDDQCDVGVTEPPPTGWNQVRDNDETHFCPTTGPIATCGVPYSPGAARFGHAQGKAIAVDLGVAPK